ncbi:MAG: hypothetical protein ABS76_23665 [Pelagibacterium sp. SCN 64-44]|nr:MAG: hypothetical protein ABS76_23665 [Pelagibacterium sp. SCN 64-44]
MCAQPAFAAWEFHDVTDDSGEAYVGTVLDDSGEILLEIYCDDWLPGMVDLTLYTGEAHDPDSSYADEGVMTVTADGASSVDITAFFDDMDGELLIYTSNFEVDNIVDVMLLMAQAQQTIGVTYFDRAYRFSAEDAFSVIERLATDCPAE